MTLTIHFNAVMITGLCLLPGAFVEFYLVGALLGWLGWELAAVAFSGFIATAMLICGVLLTVLGIGMAIG